MRQVKTCSLVATAAICLTLISFGCNNVALPLPRTASKSVPAEFTTYKVTTDRENGVLWEGAPENKPKSFLGGHSGNKIEMTFDQQILSGDAEGNSVLKITIKELKYLSKLRDQIVLDFDSCREQEKDNPLSKLIGQSYTIELNASGEVSKIIDVNDARAALTGNSISDARAAQLLSTEAIIEQHSIPVPPNISSKKFIPGKKWSNIKTFSFRMMGAKSFERIYEILRISEIDGRQIAIAQMNAVPSTAKAKELYKEEQQTGLFSAMFDNTETYTGVLNFDLATGQIEKYNEEFRSVWTAVDPLATKQEKEPDRFQMSATRVYRIERIN
ncbi:MAG: hypothetical protein JW837_05225 [Sedimentisphaerales bacterium]|nr:hypothetical protein [Sedimentisphaerales bacterium]